MLICSFTLVLSSIVSLGAGSPLKNLFGDTWCWINWFFGVSFYIYSSVNSFGLALYRMVIMRYITITVSSYSTYTCQYNTCIFRSPGIAQDQKGDKNLACGIGLFMVTTSTLVMYSWNTGLGLTKVTMLDNFCTGRNNLMSNVIAEYQGRTRDMRLQGKILIKLMIYVHT